MLSAIIVEDEIPAAERLRILLQDCDVLLLETFVHAEKALQWLSTHEVDVVFADIGLPDMDGLAFIGKLPFYTKKMPAVIFTTAHEEHALQAFELAAVDYLLKPIKINRLRNALSRVDNTKNMEDEFVAFNVVRRDQIIQVPWQKAAYLLAKQKVVFLYTYDDDVFELPNTLIYWEEILKDKVLRIHRNTLIMRHALHSLSRENEDEDEQHWVANVADMNVSLPVSRRQLAFLRRALN